MLTHRLALSPVPLQQAQQQSGESLEEQLGQRLLRMPPPAAVSGLPRGPGAAHAPIQPATFRLPEEAPILPAMDPAQVNGWGWWVVVGGVSRPQLLRLLHIDGFACFPCHPPHNKESEPV